MPFSTYFHEALFNLLSSKLRTLLALLGILVGTASVVAMVSGGQLATNEALKQFKTLGTDLLAFTISDSEEDQTKQNAGNLSLSDALSIIHSDDHIQNVAPLTQLFNPLEYNGRVISGGVLGVTEQFFDIAHIEIEKGRALAGVDKYALFCVIGQQVYQEMKRQTLSDPLGQQLQIGKNYFTVIGVAKTWSENSFVYADVDRSVMVPLLTSAMLSQYAYIYNVILKITPQANSESVTQHVTTYMNQRLPGKHLYFRSAKEILASMTKQSKILTVFLGLVGGVSLLVGGIGVMNIMLVSVVERRREIGIRLAIGAKRTDIAYLFLAEAIMLSLVGGLLGVMVGSLIAYIIAYVWHWEFVFFLLPPLIGFSVSAAIGVFFGFYPALQASRLNPIEALRSE